MANFGLFRGFSEKLFQGELPINLGEIGSEDITPITYLLDLYPSAAAAYSLRKLRSGYTGSAIRVRRSSDNTEQDIGFRYVNLDTTALTTFCGSGNGFVTTWYDQSGNARNATQNTAENQPQIVSSGSVILDGGKPAFQNTATTGFKTATIGFSGYDNLSFIGVMGLQFSATAQILFETSETYSSTTGAFICFQNGTTNYQIGLKTGSFIANNYTSVVNGKGLFNQYINDQNSGVNASEMYANGVLLTEANQVTTTPVSFTDQFLSLFSRNGSSIGLIGTVQEFILYPNQQFSNQNGINTNINSFYSIY